MQPMLFETGEYVDDKIIIGKQAPSYRHENHSNRGMARPFIAWDGEGYTDEWGQHHYWLLANSLGDKIIAPPGRSIERWNIARVFHNSLSRYPDGINVGFALGYDYTMLLRSNGITPEQYKSIQEKQWMVDSGYVWRVMMGKQLTTWVDGDKASDRFNLQDTWGFYQRSFVKALDEYFGKDWPHRDLIIEMKNKRSSFTRDQDVEVENYNDIELALLVTLMEELRDRLFQSGMPVSRWYGPGAIANGLLQRWKIKTVISNLYDETPNVAAASQFAYAGGRFELVKPGHVNGKTYQYDINSAYPYALSTVPDLKDGEWKHVDSPSLDDLPEFSVVRIRWNTNIDYGDLANAQSEQEIYPLSIPFPFWRRFKDGTIAYPSTGIHGWYWLPEVKAGIRYGDSLPDMYGVSYSIEEAYAYFPNTGARPYNTIPLLYNTRLRLKEQGNGAHIGIKLGLNSLYGKFAQQIGYDDTRKRIPPYHNLAIAGYITAICRGMMIDATMSDPTAVIAYETDGVFSTRPLDLTVSSDLGSWDQTTYDDMYYYQSGFRFGISDGSVAKAATRGVPASDIDLDRIKSLVTRATSEVPISKTQFITLGQAYAWNKPHLAGQWKESPKVLSVMLESADGKRMHDPDCQMCDPIVIDGQVDRVYRWEQPHFTLPKTGNEGQLNYPHRVLWSDLSGVSEERDIDPVIEP